MGENGALSLWGKMQKKCDNFGQEKSVGNGAGLGGDRKEAGELGRMELGELVEEGWKLVK